MTQLDAMARTNLITGMMQEYEVELNQLSNQELLAYWQEMKRLKGLDDTQWQAIALKAITPQG